MGKLARIVIAGTLSLGMFGGVTSAQTPQCTINGTGPDSVNSCEFDEEKNLTIRCENDVEFTIDNDQVANSGESIVDNNNTSGGASSGDASNNNQVTAAIEAKCGTAAANPDDGNGGAPIAPPAGGQGGGAPAAPAPAAPAAGGQGGAQAAPAEVKALPQTGANDLAVQAGVGALGLGTVAAVAHLALAGYRRFSLGL